MSLEGFVRSAGAAMGFARESFGAGGVGLAPAPAGLGLGTIPTGFGAGSGLAADGFAAESGALGNEVTALGEFDQAGEQQLREALSAAGVGRGRMDSVIAAAVADVTAMGASTNTPAGQRALVAAVKRHLEDTKGTLDEAGGDASTRAAAANVSAAGYQGIGQPSPGAATAMASMPAMPQLPSIPMGGGGFPMSAALAPLSGLTSLLSQGRQPATGGPFAGAQGSVGGDGSAGEQVVKRALSQLGVKYSFGGGGKNGPSAGDAGVGFDCSGLVQYAYGGVGADVPRTTYQLQHAGVAVPPGQARPGDILLCNYSAPGVPQHVQIVMSATQTVEAPDRGLTVRVGRWPSGHVEVRRLVNG